MAKTTKKPRAAKAKARPGRMPVSDVWIIAALGALAGAMTPTDAVEAANHVSAAYAAKYLTADAVGN